jgi:hypothetical protein
MRKHILWLGLAMTLLSSLAACRPIDLTGVGDSLGCAVGSLDNHFPNERDPGC